jgi:hypothetical protein
MKHPLCLSKYIEDQNFISTEMFQGDLKHFLLQHRGEAHTLAQRGDVDRLMCEVAAGLQHLSSAGFVHT